MLCMARGSILRSCMYAELVHLISHLRCQLPIEGKLERLAA